MDLTKHLTPQGSAGSARTKSAADETSDSARIADLIEKLPLWRRPGFLIRRLHQIHYALFFEEFGDSDVTPVQYGLLTILSNNPGCDQITIANSLGIDRTNVADVLGRLAAAGLVQRERSTVDRRSNVARLTPKGEETLASMMPAMARAQTRLLEGLEPQQREDFMQTMITLLEKHNKHGRAQLKINQRESAV
jgi:DNA-binding MarR family transcriptional regulator